jgi:hypothetical protein
MQIFDWLKQITYEKQSWDSFTEEDKTSFNHIWCIASSV